MVGVLGESGISCRGTKGGVPGGELGVNGTCAGFCCLRVIASKVSIFCCCWMRSLSCSDCLELLTSNCFLIATSVLLI
jgi:hypothetical protein